MWQGFDFVVDSWECKGRLSMATRSVHDTVQRLRTAAADLNRVSDELNASVKEIEKSLKEMNIGLEVWCSTTLVGANDLYLGYTKLENQWGLVIQRDRPSGAAGQMWRFNEAPREFRVKVLPLLPFLLADILRKVEKISMDLQGTVERLKPYKKLLGGSPNVEKIPGV